MLQWKQGNFIRQNPKSSSRAQIFVLNKPVTIDLYILASDIVSDTWRTDSIHVHVKPPTGRYQNAKSNTKAPGTAIKNDRHVGGIWRISVRKRSNQDGYQGFNRSEKRKIGWKDAAI